MTTKRLFVMSVHEGKDPDDRHRTRDVYRLQDQQVVIGRDDAIETARQWLDNPNTHQLRHKYDIEFFYCEGIGSTFNEFEELKIGRSAGTR